MRKVDFYRSKSGECPVEVFLNSLSAKQAQKVVWVLKLIEDLSVLPKQYFKKLTGTDDIWEVRIILASDIFRVLGFFYQGNTFIATHGFRKKTDKIPKKEILRATSYKCDFLSR